MYSCLSRGLLPLSLDSGFHLIPGPLHHLLNASRMNSAIQNEALQGNTGHLPPHRIKTGERNRFRGIIYNQVHAGGMLQGSDVAALASNETSLHFIARERNHRYRALGYHIGSTALHGLGQDVSTLPIAFLSYPYFHLTHASRCLVTNLALHPLKQYFLRLSRSHGGNQFQFMLLSLPQLFRSNPRPFHILLLSSSTILTALESFLSAVQILIPLIQT